MRSPDAVHSPKHRQVYDALVQQIAGGRMRAGERLPSEADLVRRFGASRITVGRALRDLQIGRPGGAPCRLWHVRAGTACGDARAGLWRVDAGSRRRRGVRRDLSRPARSPRGAAARAGMGQPDVDLDVESRSRVAALRAVHRAPGGRRVLRADRTDGGQRLGEPAHRRRAGRGAYSGGAHRPRHRAVSPQGASRPGGPGQSPRRRAGDRASAVGWMHAPGVSGAAQRGVQRRWTRSGIS